MRALLLIILAICLAYLVAWPTPVAPVAWEAPQDRGYSGAFESNDRLASMNTRPIAPFGGPETLAATPEGGLVTGTETGELLHISADGEQRVVARLGGRPLGVAVGDDGAYYVANAGIGLQKVHADGKMKLLAKRVGDTPILYANSVDVAGDGRVFFTDSSQRFGPDEYGGTLGASILDLMEQSASGRLLQFDPATETASAIADGLSFPNGIALDPAGEFLLLAETGRYRILKVWLRGERRGTHAVIIDNLPGFPDNISRGNDGRYWVGLVAPREPILDKLARRPFVRKMIARLPPAFRPSPADYAHLLAIDADGNIIMNLQSSLGPLTRITGAIETPNDLYVSSLSGSEFGVIPTLALDR